MNNNKNVRQKIPLVHCITNYVTVNDVANALLACGGSPIMADDIAEAGEIASISNALVLNIGTLNERTIASMIKAGKAANTANIPVVLDPVGAGASSLRNDTVKELVNKINFSVIRGNLSEISYLAGLSSNTRGVDSSDEDSKNDAVSVAKLAARQYKTVIAVTGAVDVVTDGERVAKISNGVALMGKVTGTGCMLSGVVGAYVGVNDDAFEAAVSAITSMGIAGEMAFARAAELGTGSFHIAIIDALSKIDDEIIAKDGKVNYEA